MEKVAHGIYALDDVWPDELFVLQERNKNIIYSGETALYLHGLTDREYSQLCFTVPTGYNATHIKKENKQVRYANAETLELGTCEVPSSSGNMVKAYDRERCICDLIKDRKKYEIQTFQTAIKEYMALRDKNLTRLIDYAIRLGVRDEVMKYVEVMV
ncbi:MAG: abortive phage infection protein [Lachnospiraceae bacterium]|nr:abortive phage infection protein [Lachnospiraceae bacterium]